MPSLRREQSLADELKMLRDAIDNMRRETATNVATLDTTVQNMSATVNTLDTTVQNMSATVNTLADDMRQVKADICLVQYDIELA